MERGAARFANIRFGPGYAIGGGPGTHPPVAGRCILGTIPGERQNGGDRVVRAAPTARQRNKEYDHER